jgi:hypothetical protein
MCWINIPTGIGAIFVLCGQGKTLKRSLRFFTLPLPTQFPFLFLLMPILTPEENELSADQKRWLKFPDDEPVGKVYWFDPTAIPVGSRVSTKLRDELRLERLGCIQASGRIAVPTGMAAYLVIDIDADGEFLSTCDPTNTVVGVSIQFVEYADYPYPAPTEPFHFSNLGGLRWLSIEVLDAEKVSLRDIANLGNLEELSIQHHDWGLTFDVVNALPKLRRLEISDPNFSQCFSTSLRELSLLPVALLPETNGSRFSYHYDFDDIDKCFPNLVEHDVVDFCITRDGLANISRLSSLEKVRVHVDNSYAEFDPMKRSGVKGFKAVLDEQVGGWRSILPSTVAVEWFEASA